MPRAIFQRLKLSVFAPLFWHIVGYLSVAVPLDISVFHYKKPTNQQYFIVSVEINKKLTKYIVSIKNNI